MHLAASCCEFNASSNRGVGLSTDKDWPGNVSIQNYAESTVDLISALKLDKPDVLGWSMVTTPPPPPPPTPPPLPPACRGWVCVVPVFI